MPDVDNNNVNVTQVNSTTTTEHITHDITKIIDEIRHSPDIEDHSEDDSTDNNDEENVEIDTDLESSISPESNDTKHDDIQNNEEEVDDTLEEEHVEDSIETETIDVTPNLFPPTTSVWQNQKKASKTQFVN